MTSYKSLIVYVTALVLVTDGVSLEKKPELCSLIYDEGDCNDKSNEELTRYFYNKENDTCKSFTYSGCQGNKNNFNTEIDCNIHCKCSMLPCLASSSCLFGRVNDTDGCQTCHCFDPCATTPCGRSEYCKIDNDVVCKKEPCLPVGKCQENKKKMCNLPVKIGPCDKSVIRYFFDRESGKCDFFHYGGCDGNENNFKTMQECREQCDPFCDRNTCNLECEHGYEYNENNCPLCKCYDPCKKLSCGDDVCYIEKMVCIMAPCPSVARCVPKESCIVKGCREILERCDKETGDCKPTPRGVCHRNLLDLEYPYKIGAFIPKCKKDGNFEVKQCHGSIGACWCVTNQEGSEIEGTRTILNDKPVNCNKSVICRQEKYPGSCFGHMPRYYYSQATKRCEKFIYGGCGAKHNNFMTLQACRSTCSHTCNIMRCQWACKFGYEDDVNGCRTCICKNPCKNQKCDSGRTCVVIKGVFTYEPRCQDICELPKETGPCESLIDRYFYNSTSLICELFKYGGCNANENNFETLTDCTDKCPQKLTCPPVCSIACEFGNKGDINGCPTCSCNDPCEGVKCMSLGSKCKVKRKLCKDKACRSGAVCISKHKGTCPPLPIISHVVRCAKPVDKCLFDSDCSSNKKCCRRTVCGGATCGPTTEEICLMKKETGNCEAIINKFYFDSTLRKCIPFVYGGCKGNENNYDNLRDCQNTCHKCEDISDTCMLACLLDTDKNGCRICKCASSKTCGGRQCEDDERCVADKCVESRKRGVCPFVEKEIKDGDSCAEPQCVDDANCPGTEKCCRSKNGCVGNCVPAISPLPRTGYCEVFATPDPYPPCARPPHNCRYDEDCDGKGYKCCNINFCGGKTCKAPMNVSRCQLPKDVGGCEFKVKRFFFNKAVKHCEEFIYSGCSGNGNNFMSMESCKRNCPAIDIPCIPRPCPESCEFGYKRDDNDCPTCECKDKPENRIPCSAISCAKPCEYGSKLDQNDCPTCECKDKPVVVPCSSISCPVTCKFGFKRDVNDCETCVCKENPCNVCDI